MCNPVPCKTCGRTTWSGCGMHVGQLRARIPADQWCDGHETDGATTSGTSFVRRLLGR